jgi:Fur family ferric uptake transcriptional regulator
MVSAQISGVQAGLRQNNHKLTRPRQVVLDIVTQANQHLTPAEIYHKAKLKYPHLGLTTVYRTLDLLVELGYVQRIHLDAGCHSYAPMARQHAHHLICSNCGRTEEFDNCDLGALIKTLRAKTGYEIDVHVLEMMGRCPSCQGKVRLKR